MRQRASIGLIGAFLAACAGGATMRVADEDSSDEQPVALAPAPESAPDTIWTPGDSTPVSGQPPAADSSLSQGYAPSDSSPSQGYAPYGRVADAGLRRIGQWSRTGIGESRRLVIRDANAWAQFWAELGVGDRPAIDFNRNVIIAVAAGQRPTGGYEIAVQGVTRSNGEMTIQVLETSPGPNCMTAAALTQPVDVVAVPRVGAESWSFIESKDVRPCR